MARRTKATSFEHNQLGVTFFQSGAVDLAIYWTLANRADNPGITRGDMFLCNDPWVGGGLHQLLFGFPPY